jgi:hypothetical protein
VARKLDEKADDEVPAHEARNRMPLPYYAVIAALVLFTMNIGYEKFKDMDSISVTENQSKACIIDFRKNSCNPLNLTGPCEKILTAYKKTEDNHGQPRHVLHRLLPRVNPRKCGTANDNCHRDGLLLLLFMTQSLSMYDISLFFRGEGPSANESK